MGDRKGETAFGRKLPAMRTTALSVVVVSILLVGAPVALVAASGTATGTTAAAANFQVSDLQTPAEHPAGEPLTVSATVTNTGDVAATKTVEFGYDTESSAGIDFVKIEREIELDAGESTTVTFTDESPLSQYVRGDYGVGIVTPDDSAVASVTFVAPAIFSLSDFRAPDVLPDGDTLTVSVSVENVGETTGTKTLELRLDSIQLETQEITLPPGESTTVEFVETETRGICCITQYPATRGWSLGVEVSFYQRYDNRGRISKGLIGVQGERTLRIEGNGTYTRYEVVTNAEFINGTGLESADRLRDDGARVTGGVSGGVDEYTVKGTIESIRVDGPDDAVTIYDGERKVDPRRYGDRIRIVGSGEYTAYQFSVSGRVTDGRGLEPTDGFNYRLITGGGGESGFGAVSGGSDVYTFNGELTDLLVAGNATVFVNGREVDPAEYGGENTIRIVGNGTGVEYAFVLEGRPVNREQTEPGDGGDRFVTGFVVGGSDAYSFNGDLQAIDVPQGVKVYLNGEQVDPANFGEIHELEIIGSGEWTTYEVTVPGEFISSLSRLDRRDEFDGDTATGGVLAGSDRYVYIGPADPTSFTIDGNATVYVDGERVDPDAVSESA